MSGTFDFAPNRHTPEELAPTETSAVSFRGWEFTSKPNTPYRPIYKLTLYGMRWYLNAAGTAFDLTTNPTFNAARLRKFYLDNRTWDSYAYTHQTLGAMTCRFATPVNIPLALPNSGGLIDKFEVMIIQSNPGY